LRSDFNTGSFSYHISASNTVEFHSDHCKIRYATYPKITMQPVLQKIIERLPQKQTQRKLTATSAPPFLSNETADVDLKSIITHEWLWPRIGQWLRKNDVLVTETGTANFGILDTRFPPNVCHISQVLWGSIGYSVGAVTGAAFAAREDPLNRRTILFVGDGSLQLTVQEISTIIRRGLKPILFVINNNGYTIEKLIHGPTAEYNEINTNWKYQELLSFFGAKESKSFKVTTKEEIDNLLNDKTFSSAPYVQLVEICMETMDAPRALKVQAEKTSRANAGA